MSHIEGKSRDQAIMFPEVIDEYIEGNNPVRFIDAFVDNTNLVKHGFKYATTKATGRPPYNPGDLLKLYIYGYLNRIRSSRGLERETKRNVEVMWLIRKLTPDFKTIADFRKDNKEAIKRVFKEFIKICKGMGLFGEELVAIDGSKFKAINSKKRNFDDEKLKKRIKEIEEKIEGYFKELEENDKREEGGATMKPEELKEKIKALKERKEKYEKLREEIEKKGGGQVSLTDPDSRLMKNNQKIEVCYNVQTTVDEKHKLVIDYEATNEETDKNQLSKMAKRAKEILGVEGLEVLADKGYYDAEEIRECIREGIVPYIPEPEPGISKKVNIPEKEYYKREFKYDKEVDRYICPRGEELKYKGDTIRHGKKMKRYKGESCRWCKERGRCTRDKRGKVILRWEDEEILEGMRERVKKEKEKVKKRNLIIEHVFGTIKRGLGYGYFLMKGKGKVQAEMGLILLAYNIKRVLKIIGFEKLKEAMLKIKEIGNKISQEAKAMA